MQSVIQLTTEPEWKPAKSNTAARGGQMPSASPKMVSIVGEPEPLPDAGRVRGTARDQDWSATIERVRKVGAHIRQTDQRAKEVVRSAQAYMQHANQKVTEAEARAKSAAAAARAVEECTRRAEKRRIRPSS